MRCCALAKYSNFEVAPFPFAFTEKFASLLYVRCPECGMAFAPEIDFSLDEYYEKDYQKYVQPFRLKTGVFYSEKNAFIQTDTFKKMKTRASKHLSLLDNTPEKSILDIGAGVGICLHSSISKHKYAQELDPYSQAILKKELGVKLVKIEKTNLSFDNIVASHVLEHMDINNLSIFLASVFSILNKGGRFVVEVPDGADQVLRLRNKNRDKILFEPHTISFSASGLVNYLKRAGFSIRKVSKVKSLGILSKNELKDFMGRYETFADAAIVVVAEK